MSPPPLPPVLQPIAAREYLVSDPQKRIHTHDDLQMFHRSPAYTLITSFIVHLNACVSPLDGTTNKLSSPEDFITSTAAVTVSPEVDGITKLIQRLSSLIDSAPPDPGPRRFGNVAFRKWLQLVDEHDSEIDQYLPSTVLSGKPELLHYLKHSFGSGERLDYGTGHELSFAAFLCCIWVLGGLQYGRDEKALVIRVFDAYFKLVRKLVTTYNLEPAGSHGVWGLDDHAFLPYIFGSAQLTTFRPTSDAQAAESAADADLPKPADVVRMDVVNRERTRNLYFDAIGFIYDVKKGPFWEHSPILYDISGVQKGWGKINEGMLKMYDKEVLGKFPVVQHFRFGSIFRWPDTAPAPETPKPEFMATTRAPWAAASTLSLQAAVTRAPWASSTSISVVPSPQPSITRAPWASPISTSAIPSPTRIQPFPTPSPHSQLDGDTKSPAESEAEWVNVKTEALLGPKRTNSPDSGRGAALMGTGVVRVAETGDLSGRRPSRDCT